MFHVRGVKSRGCTNKHSVQALAVQQRVAFRVHALEPERCLSTRARTGIRIRDRSEIETPGHRRRNLLQHRGVRRADDASAKKSDPKHSHERATLLQVQPQPQAGRTNGQRSSQLVKEGEEIRSGLGVTYQVLGNLGTRHPVEDLVLQEVPKGAPAAKEIQGRRGMFEGR